MNIVLSIILVIATIFFISCKDSNLVTFREYEDHWKKCYDDNLQFGNDFKINSANYIKCQIDGKNVLLNSGSLGFQSRIYYSVKGTVYDTSVSLPLPDASEYSVLLSFMEPKALSGFFIWVDYPKDSLNYTIQKVFSNSSLTLSTNFINNGFQYLIKTSCEPSGAIRFSTLFSEQESQSIKIDSFNYRYINGNWLYYLEYSAKQLQLTNSSWNSKGKFDPYGNQFDSNIILENLQLENIEGILEFELKSD